MAEKLASLARNPAVCEEIPSEDGVKNAVTR